MHLHKIICFGIVVLIISLLANSMTWRKTCFEGGRINFTELIKDGNFEDLNLTIYYFSPTLFTFLPTSTEQLLGEKYQYRIVVRGEILREHADLLKQLDSVELVSVEEESRMDARIYYVFENEKNGETFSVAMWTSEGSIQVNGIAVAEEPVFYDVLVHFLPYQSRERMKRRAEILRNVGDD